MTSLHNLRVLGLLTVTSCLPGAARAQEPAKATDPVASFGFLATPPKGLPPMPMLMGYTPTAAMFQVGETLFHDGILSGDRSVSCATCHPASTGFASKEPLPGGVNGQRALRHAPALWNRGWSTLQRWDGSSPSLEAFVLEPIADPREMGLPLDDALARLAADERYRASFQAAFGGPPTAQHLQRALATFVRGIVAGDAPYDRFVRGEVASMTTEQRTGQWIFESKGGCWKCHTPPLFTDESFHNTGVGSKDGVPERGRASATGDEADAGAWKTPTLRRVALTAPYMHDGSLATLDDVVAFYARGGNANAHLDVRMQPLQLSASDQRALVAFLSSL